MDAFIAGFGDRVWLFGLFAFAVLCARYLLISGGGYLAFWILFSDRLRGRLIQKDGRRQVIVRTEIFWSIVSFGTMAGLAALIYWFYIRGWTRISTRWGEHSAFYHAFSLLLVLFAHDAYFYWMHRALHSRALFKRVHRIHHLSLNPTPWAAFSFHPFEAAGEMLFLVPLLILVPVHVGTLGIFLLLSHFFNMLGHSGYEVFPRGTWDRSWGSWITTTTHHNLHHQYFNGNYGLYLRFWDRRFGTLHEKTSGEFRRVTE